MRHMEIFHLDHSSTPLLQGILYNQFFRNHIEARIDIQCAYAAKQHHGISQVI